MFARVLSSPWRRFTGHRSQVWTKRLNGWSLTSENWNVPVLRLSDFWFWLLTHIFKVTKCHTLAWFFYLRPIRAANLIWGTMRCKVLQWFGSQWAKISISHWVLVDCQFKTGTGSGTWLACASMTKNRTVLSVDSTGLPCNKKDARSKSFFLLSWSNTFKGLGVDGMSPIKPMKLSGKINSGSCAQCHRTKGINTIRGKRRLFQ